MTSRRALLVEDIHVDGRIALESAGFEVTMLTSALDEAELIEQAADCQVIGLRSKTQVTAEVVAALPQLQAIGAFCIGTNQIDLAAAGRSGIAVFNAPFSNTRSVVELALAEIISLTRRLTEKNERMHRGEWDKSASGLHEVRGRTLGIVGYGHIGTQLSVLAENLGMQVHFYDIADRMALGNAHQCGSLDELLSSVDVVTLHVDGRQTNTDFFGAEHFSRMRPGSIFLNLSRGFVVDQEALRAALESGHLSGAAVDVFPQEPKARGEQFQSPLQGMANVILTPHIGGSTEEAQQDIGRFVGGKLRDYFRFGQSSLSVNFPQLATPPAPERGRRIALVHRNSPGVLAAINGLFGAEKVNIDSQVLGTRDALGYVITDVSCDLPQTLVDGLCQLPETVRLRVLP